MSTLTGTVEKIDFTYGSPFGNQWTTIDGKRYATWWDYRTHQVRIGARVEYQRTADQSCDIGHGAQLICKPCAHILRVLP